MNTLANGNMCKRRKVFSFNSELYKVTGVQKVLMDIHHAVKEDYDAIIVGTVSYGMVDKSHQIFEDEYKQFKNPFMFYDSIVVLHERKFLLLFWILNHIFFQHIKLVYVHHNIFHNHKVMAIMPTTVVSISDKCTENLMNYFKVPKRHIHKISNCVRELYPHFHDCPQADYISIIYPARINNIKRQIEVYKHLKGKVKEQIKIKFVGTGPCYEELRKIIAGDSQFECLGFRNDVLDLLQKSNYMMLFSTTEGLPITLIEASMCGCPIICNDVGGNLEIAHDGENAFIANSWNELVCVLNSLLDIPKDDYMAMCAKSREIYLSRFTFDMFKQKYLELFSIL